MNRAQLEHVIRASTTICHDDEVIIIGSQAILGAMPDAPADLLVSMEADVLPKNAPERTIEIDGAMGELSPFHTTFGYYAHGISEETATLPPHWRDRLIPVVNANTQGRTGFCLAPVDIAASKLAAGRDKDLRFVSTLFKHRIIAVEDVLRVIAEMPIETRAIIEHNLRQCIDGTGH
jgi:hypothetical protein